MYDVLAIAIGATAGVLRALIGYIKAHLKHGEGFSVPKFGFTTLLGAAVGGATELIRISPSRVEIIIVSIAGVVVIDEVLQALFLRRPKSPAAKPAKTE